MPPATRYVAVVWTMREMPDTPKFLLTLTKTGDWILRPHGQNANQEHEAITLAAFDVEGEDPIGVVHVEAASSTASGMPEPVCFDTHLVQAWLYYLGRTGQVSLTPGPRSASPQVIPRRFALPIDLIKQQRGSVESAVLNCRGICSPADLVRLAPKTSVAGIAARIGRENELLALMRLQATDYWMDLVSPLYHPLTPLGDGEQAFTIALTETVSGYLWLPGAVIMEHCHVQVSRDGAIAAAVLPVDAFGFVGEFPVCANCDGGYRPDLDGCVATALRRVPEIAERILRDLLCNLPTGVYADFVDTDVPDPPRLATWMEAVTAAIQDDLFAIEQCLRWNVYPCDGRDRPLRLTQWLQAGNAQPLQRRRTQALTAMPGGVGALVSDGERRALEAIDQAQPLVSAIREAYDVPSWVARRALNHKGAHSGDQELHERIWGRPRFKPFVQLIHALGQNAPALPPRHLQQAQWLIDAFQSDCRHFVPPMQTVQRVLHALGRTASRFNWDAAMDLVTPILRCRLSLILLDRIATATITADLPPGGSNPAASRPSIDAIANAWLSELDADAWLSRGKRLAALPWNATDPALAYALQMALRESRPRAALLNGQPGADTAVTTRLLWPHSSLSTRTSIYPLYTRASLEEEGTRMRNCLASHWGSVWNHDQVIVALEEAATESRANASLELDEEGSWWIKEIAGADNASIDHASPLRRTASELAEHMTAHPDDLDQAMLRAFRERSEELRRPIEIEAFDALAVQCLPEPLAVQVLACLPGAGDVEKRISHVVKRTRSVDSQTLRTAVTH